MKLPVPIVAAVICVAGFHFTAGQTTSTDGAASTYEHLATAIIAIRETEDALVRDILTGYTESAIMHLEAAATHDHGDRARDLEMAADQIANIASEGDRAMQAVRQRLLDAGHHHHTDSETEEDYIFIDSKEKAELLAMAKKISRLASASSLDIELAAGELSQLFERVMAEG